jgi:hypothetical protein
MDLSDTKVVLEDVLKVQGTTRSDRVIVRAICEMVG